MIKNIEGFKRPAWYLKRTEKQFKNLILKMLLLLKAVYLFLFI
jgi:hypothetical protein